MKKNIFLVSLVIATLSSCTENVTNNNTAQYVGNWNYTSKGSLIATITNGQSNIPIQVSIFPINVTGIAIFRQDSDYIDPLTNMGNHSKGPNKIDITPDIFTTITSWSLYNQLVIV